MKAYTLTAAERDTVLAALRLWQAPGTLDRFGHAQRTDLMAVATNCGKHPPLDDADVDALCERINT